MFVVVSIHISLWMLIYSYQILMNVQSPLQTVHNYVPILMEVTYAHVIKVTLLELIRKAAMVCKYLGIIFDINLIMLQILMNVPSIMETVPKHVSIPLEALCAHVMWAMDLI